MDKIGSLFPALRFRDLRFFLIGVFISLMGSYMQGVGLAWQVYQMTHSAFLLGMMGLIGLIPKLIVFIPAGLIVDKFHKKNVLLVAELLSAVLVFCMFFLTQLHIINLFSLFLLMFFIAVINTLETPARLATVPLLVPTEHLSQALSFNTLFREIGAVAGPALGGFLIALYGVQSIYLFNTISYIIFFLLLLPVAIPHVVQHVAFSKERVLEGFRFIRHSTIIAITILLDFLATFFAGAMVLLPIFAKDIYHVGAQGLGLLYAAPAIGSIVIASYFSSRPKIAHQGKLLVIAIALFGLATVGFGIATSFVWGFIFLTLLGAADMVSTIIRNLIQQHLIPDHLRGRVMSTVMIFFLGGPNLGDMEAGFVAGFFGAPFSVISGGILTLLLIGAVAWKVPALRTYEDKQ